MGYAYDLERVRSLPLRELLVKTRLRAWRISLAVTGRSRDRLFRSYETGEPARLIRGYFTAPSPGELAGFAKGLDRRTTECLLHTFDLLGSGPVRVFHAVRCPGLGGYRYEMGERVEADVEGRWLAGRINPTNMAESRRVWSLVDPDYVPIDWQLDFKSGYRWSEKTWYLDVPVGRSPGADSKVPWELARMQHHPRLALAHSLAVRGAAGFAAPELIQREFRNQVLDFIATNPPRYGVNWRTSTEAAIRVANWLVAYDLFVSCGARFDAEFESLLGRSVYEHGRHIIENLEWSSDIRGNHYLADIVGLLFAAAYLERAPQVDAWLAFAVRQLVEEVGYEFGTDGANFEGSTAYHGLTAEMVIYATALTLGLPSSKREALRSYDHRRHGAWPGLERAPVLFYTSASSGEDTPFPHWYVGRLERMAEFTVGITGPDGHVPQIGDDDSGRFLDLLPAGSKASDTDFASEAVAARGGGLDHRHLVSAANGLFGRVDFAAYAGERPEASLVADLAHRVRLPSGGGRSEGSRVDGNLGRGKVSLSGALELNAYRDFGVYVYQSESLYLAVRCGQIRGNNGGHAHNDQLSFILYLGGAPLVVDPGTYLYTPLPEQRNSFRATVSHNTFAPVGMEQNQWPAGEKGLFVLGDSAEARVVELGDGLFIGEHRGFGRVHRRELSIDARAVAGLDRYEGGGRCYFHLAPGAAVSASEESCSLVLAAGCTRARLSCRTGRLSVEPGLYSAGYGLVEPAAIVIFESEEDELEWRIELEEGEARGA